MGSLLHEILEVSLQQTQVRRKREHVRRSPGGLALETVVMAAGGVAGVEDKVVGVGRVALEAALDLRIVPVQIKDVRIECQATLQQIGLVAKLAVEIGFRVEGKL